MDWACSGPVPAVPLLDNLIIHLSVQLEGGSYDFGRQSPYLQVDLNFLCWVIIPWKPTSPSLRIISPKKFNHSWPAGCHTLINQSNKMVKLMQVLLPTGPQSPDPSLPLKLVTCSNDTSSGRHVASHFPPSTNILECFLHHAWMDNDEFIQSCEKWKGTQMSIEKEGFQVLFEVSYCFNNSSTSTVEGSQDWQQLSVSNQSRAVYFKHLKFPKVSWICGQDYKNIK